MRPRHLLVVACACAVMGSFVWRLWQLQVVRQDEFRERAAQQQLRTISLEPPRGTVFDARGRKLAVSLKAQSAFATPRAIADPEATAAALAPVLGTDRRQLARRLAGDQAFVWLERQLDHPDAERLRALGLDGVGFVREYRRYYPQLETAAQVIGFAGRDHYGLEGLEQRYESLMAGEGVERLVLRDANAGMALSPRLSLAEPEAGQDLHLTLDSYVQQLLQGELAAAVERHRAERAMGLILDPRSGAVLAMATVPAFDPNAFHEADRELWKNRVITDQFEPGSTFKVVTAAAALEGNLIDPSDTIDCEMGGIRLDGVLIRDHHPFGLLSFREVIAKSSNVGAIKIGLLVGRRALHEQIRRFGFGRPTGIDLPGEAGGTVRPLASWQLREPAYVSFGQAISVTALQLASAFAAVANGGTLYRPYVLAATARNGRVESPPRRPEVIGSPIGAATARTLERMLEAVVEEGTGRAAAVPGYRVAGKTGTAQKAVAGGYSPDKHLANFVGFAPARDAAFVAVIVIDEPVGAYHGGEVAAPVFARVARELLPYLGVPPDQPVAPPPAVAASRLAAAPAPGSAPGPAPAPVPAGAVPDLRGLSARRAVARAADIGLEPHLYGSGIVFRQSPLPGTTLADAGQGVELWLAAAAAAGG